MDIISVQSRVKSGFVGNAIAVPTLTATGIHAHPIDTVTMLHHPGRGPVTPEVTSAAALDAALETAMTSAPNSLGILSGYLATPEQGRIILKYLRDNTPYYLDPVFGDDTEGAYVDPALITFYKNEAVPACTVLLPNRYELAHLSGISVDSPSEAVSAARRLIARGPSVVVVSSVPSVDGRICNVLVTAENAHAVRVNRLDLRAKGTGDMLSAAFTGLHAQGISAADALLSAVRVVEAASSDASLRDAVELNPPKILEIFDFRDTHRTNGIAIESLEH